MNLIVPWRLLTLYEIQDWQLISKATSDFGVEISPDTVLFSFIYGLRDIVLMIPAMPFHIVGFLRWRESYKIYWNKSISNSLRDLNA